MNSLQKWHQLQEDAEFEKTYKKRTKNVQKTYSQHQKRIGIEKKRKNVLEKRTILNTKRTQNVHKTYLS